MFVSRQTLSALIILLVAHVLLVGPSWAAGEPGAINVPGLAVHDKGNGDFALGEMASLTDDQLSDVTGQSLLYTTYKVGDSVVSGGVMPNGQTGFSYFGIGADVQMDMNMNIKKMQLGCGGVNGAGNCDIDIDNLSLTGNCSSNRPNCDLVMTRPLMEFAIKNPGSLANRTVSGVRISAQNVTGLMTAGTNDGTQNGINNFSGYMSIAATTGTTMTAAGNFTNAVSGRANIGGCIAGCPATYTTDTKPLAIPSLSGVNFNVPAFVVNGSRLTGVSMSASAPSLPNIPITDPGSGSRSATFSGCFVVLIVPLCNYKINTLYISGTITGLKANMTINEDLGYLHSIPLNNPFSLSLQKENIQWPNLAASALRGWWMAVSDPVNLGSLSTPSGYAVDISAVYPQVATAMTNYLTANPLSIPFGDAIGTIFSGTYHANVGTMNLSAAPALTTTLTNLPLGTAQDVASNCWGSLTFC